MIKERDMLYDLYIVQELSLREIAKMFDTTKVTIKNRLERYDITLRPRGARLKKLEVQNETREK